MKLMHQKGNRLKHHRFLALDGLRGVAAIAVLLLHTGQVSASWLAPHGGLAVDLFFALSGFVLASAYGQKLEEGMSIFKFMRLRVIRLYPLAIVGALLGVLSYYRIYDKESLSIIFITGALLVPTPLAPKSEEFNAMPANPPAWSLTAEVAGNLFFAVIAPVLSNKILYSVVLFFAAILCVASYSNSGINFGPFWPSLWGGVPRFGFSFFMGVILFRLWKAGNLSFVRAPFVLIMALMCVVFAWPINWPLNWLFDLVAAMILFPLFITAAANEIPVRLAPLSLLAGELSYPIYILQGPFIVHIKAIPSHFGLIGMPALLVILVIDVLYIGFAWIVLQYFDRPVRAFLQNLGRRPSIERSIS